MGSGKICWIPDKVSTEAVKNNSSVLTQEATNNVIVEKTENLKTSKDKNKEEVDKKSKVSKESKKNDQITVNDSMKEKNKLENSGKEQQSSDKNVENVPRKTPQTLTASGNCVHFVDIKNFCQECYTNLKQLYHQSNFYVDKINDSCAP